MDDLEDEFEVEDDRRMNYCDGKGCGPAVLGRIFWSLPSGDYLKLCLHHSNLWRESLTTQGACFYELSA